MANTISNQDDVIDSRDVIDRIDELQAERDAIESDLADYDAGTDDHKAATALLAEWDSENGDELKALVALQDEAEGYANGDWKHGSMLIRRSYFVEYCEELVKDIGDMPNEIPSYIEIDWQKTADNIEADYTSVDFDGVEYLIR